MEHQNKSHLFRKPGVILLMAVVCTMLWGSAFPCIKVGYELFGIADMPSKVLFAGYRFALAGIFTILFGCVSQKKLIHPTSKNLGGITLLGLVQTSLQYFLFYIGLSHTTGVKGSIITATGTFAAVIMAHFCYRDDKITVRKSLGCLVGFAGVVLINLGGDMQGGFSFLGEGLMILSTIASAMGAVISKNEAGKADPVTLTGYQLLIGGVVLILMGIPLGGTLKIETAGGWVLFFYLALLSSVAFVIWTILLKYNPVGKITVYNFLTPMFGTILSAVFLQEELFRIQNLAALVLVCCGILIVNKPKKA